MYKLKLLNFNCFLTRNSIKIKALLFYKKNELFTSHNGFKPIESLFRFTSKLMKIKIELYDESHQLVGVKETQSDRFGNINTTIPFAKPKQISKIKLYLLEPKFVFLSELSPQAINRHGKMIICDFDKTLVDTKYRTPKEIFHSLTGPISQYRKIGSSVDLFKSLIDKGYSPFIVSASPHFYELAIRKWINQEGLPQCPMTLKNYRDIFSLWHERLSFKDLLVHGNYKLQAMLDILIMTGIPEDLVLIGDSSETDPEIYLLLKNLLTSEQSIWELWKEFKDLKCFQLTNAQSSQILRKINLLKGKINLAKGRGIKVSIQIYIRKVGLIESMHEDIIYY